MFEDWPEEVFEKEIQDMLAEARAECERCGLRGVEDGGCGPECRFYYAGDSIEESLAEGPREVRVRPNNKYYQPQRPWLGARVSGVGSTEGEAL